MSVHIGVYLILSPSGKGYIGMSTVSIENRWKAHKSQLLRGVHKCAGLQRAANKYGIDTLNFSILEIFDSQTPGVNILQAEKRWWETLDKSMKLYNGKPTGTGSISHSKETKEKIRQSALRTHPKHSEYKRQCGKCKITFVSKDKGHRTCSSCRLIRAPKIRQTSICVYCEKKFISVSDSKFCSMICYNAKRSPDVKLDTIFDLKNAGLSLRQIGQQLGYSHTKIAKILNSSALEADKA